MRTQAQDLEEDIALTSAQAQLELDRRELALAVAKVAVNEAGFRSPQDVALIWQVTEARGRTHADRLSWLRRHSSCVLTDRPLNREELRRGNCSWTRYLGDDDAQPEGWPSDLVWSNFVRRWRQIRQLSLRLVDGRSRLRPCTETPRTWGGIMDHTRALERGLRPIRCEGTLNTGFVVAEVDPG